MTWTTTNAAPTSRHPRSRLRSLVFRAEVAAVRFAVNRCGLFRIMDAADRVLRRLSNEDRSDRS